MSPVATVVIYCFSLGNWCEAPGTHRLGQFMSDAWIRCPVGLLCKLCGRSLGSVMKPFMLSIFVESLRQGGSFLLVTSKQCEVQLQTGAASPKIVGVKPKLWLTAAVVLPPHTWTKV